MLKARGTSAIFVLVCLAFLFLLLLPLFDPLLPVLPDGGDAIPYHLGYRFGVLLAHEAYPHLWGTSKRYGVRCFVFRAAILKVSDHDYSMRYMPSPLNIKTSRFTSVKDCLFVAQELVDVDERQLTRRIVEILSLVWVVVGCCHRSSSVAVERGPEE